MTKNILYIEDDPINIELVRQILLKRPNYKFHFALNAQKGIEIALSKSPDLILMDINMPDMDGLTAFKELARSPITQCIPVIAVSACSMIDEIDKALELGFHSYITKPINVEGFLESVDRIMLMPGSFAT